MYLIGYDVGSSSVKAALLDAETGRLAASAVSPDKELGIISEKNGWAEQQPQIWWENVKIATARLLAKANVDAGDIKAIGIAYQMHGLVLVDKNKQVLRPAIIWCDSRAVEIGHKAFVEIGERVCFEHMLNSPANFTASKLKWVMDNEPEIFAQVHKFMLPGDYIAMKIAGSITTTIPGLSEAILWDYKVHAPAKSVLDNYGIKDSLIPEVAVTFSHQGELTGAAADELGLKAGTKIAYRGGDQPNNAMSLNVLNPGEIAATAGTSGVVCGIGSAENYKPESRVNAFAHVNYTIAEPMLSMLMCVSGTGILNSWLKHNVSGGCDYPEMNKMAATVPIGSEGLVILPYGNGVERTLGNRDVGASVHGLRFNTHSKAHLLRAGQEGICFALNYGLEIMRKMGIEISTIRAGEANMFLSPLFASAFATVAGAVVELYDTDGAQGAARGAGIGAGVYKNSKEAFAELKMTKRIEPNDKQKDAYRCAYENWLKVLHAVNDEL